MRQNTDSNAVFRRGGGNGSRRKKLAAITASVLAGAMLLTGTFAWSSISQRATNPAEGETYHGGRIHDHFDGENKDVFAENFGSAPIFVRIMLKEFMEVDGVSFSSTAVRGDYTTWTTHIPVGNRVADNNNANLRRFRDYVSWQMGGQTAFMPTFNQERVGVGSLETEASGEGIDYVTGGQTAAGANDGSADFWTAGQTTTGTLRYTDEDGLPATEANVVHTARNTLEPMNGIPNNGVITMAQWNAMAPRPRGNFWVIDTDGWAYWASPLQPGQATSLLLDSISINEPDGSWFYAIHVIGEFASRSSLSDWENSPFGAPSDNAGRVLDNTGNTFARGGVEYVILSDSMGPGGHGTGDYYLVMSSYSLRHDDFVDTPMFAHGRMRWNAANATVGGYNQSEIRSRLVEFYNTQTWAHGLAILPASSTPEAWGMRNISNGGDHDDLTVSSGVLAGGPGTLDGAFLLSTCDLDVYFARMADRATVYTDGTYALWWTRSPANDSQVIRVTDSGGRFIGNASTTSGIRPVMILSELP